MSKLLLVYSIHFQRGMKQVLERNFQCMARFISFDAGASDHFINKRLLPLETRRSAICQFP